MSEIIFVFAVAFFTTIQILVIFGYIRLGISRRNYNREMRDQHEQFMQRHEQFMQRYDRREDNP